MRTSTAPEFIDSLQEHKAKWVSFKILFDGLKETKFAKISYSILLVIFIGLVPSILIAIAYDSPFVVALIILIILVFNFVYLGIVKPMNDKFNCVESMIYEVIGLFIYICVLLLANYEDENPDTTEVLADSCIIYGMVAYYIAGTLFFAVHLIKGTAAGF